MTETVTAAVITLGVTNTERELGISYRQLDFRKVEQKPAFHGIISGTARCVNTKRSLTRSLDLGEEGLAMQATRELGSSSSKRAARCIKPGCRSPLALSGLGLCRGHITDELSHLGADEFEVRIAEMFAGQFTVSGECWEFSGHRHKGYGRITLNPSGIKRKVLMNNYVLQLRLGRRASYGALHRCDNPPCFRPCHIYEGTARQNSEDRAASGHTAAGPNHGKTRLTPAQVREIVARYEPGHNRWHRGNAYLLAPEFGITRAYLLMIIKNGHWSLGINQEGDGMTTTEETAEIFAVPGSQACTTCGARVATAGLRVCTRHIKDELGLTYRQVDHAVRAGLLRPERKNGSGSGSPRVWPETEIHVAQAMGRLIPLGLTPAAACRVARSGQIRVGPGSRIWLELGPPLSGPCERGDCEGCPDVPGDCGCGHHADEVREQRTEGEGTG